MTNPEPRRPTRREFLALGVGAFAVAVAPRALRPGRRLVRRTVPLMGTVADLGVVHRDERHAQGAINAAIEALRRVEHDMTRFRTDSDIGRANNSAARDGVAVDASTARVVVEALRWAKGTNGAFDPAIGRLIAAWDVAHRHEPLPAQIVARYAGRSLHAHVEVGRSNGHAVLRFHDADAALDLGGIAKGYGVDRAVAALRDWGISDGIVNVGGDLYAMGTSEDGDPWKVGIRSATDPSRLHGTITLENQAVATSGDYEQGFEFNGRRYHHLLDPRTAEPRRVAMHTLSVTADDCMSADAAATALFGQPHDAARQTLARLAPRAQLIHAG